IRPGFSAPLSPYRTSFIFHHSLWKAWMLLATLIGTGGGEIQLPAMQGRVGKGAIQRSSFRGDAKHRTRNLEIPGLALARHPGMTIRSQLPEQGVAAGDLDLARRGLEVELLHRAVLDQHRVALGAD